MRKRLVPNYRRHPVEDAHWLDLQMVTAEITSEDSGHPIEFALLRDDERGWRASEPGVQTLRVLFDQPQDLRRIFLEFVEAHASRTQEFVLRWSDGRDAARDIVRQQWNFSPAGAVRETEDYRVELTGVRMLELTINPDIGGAGAYASLRQLRLA
jgi:hypothetical protein